MTLRSAVKDSLSDLAGCARFYSRLPVPCLPWETHPYAAPDFAVAPRMLPLAGAILGCVCAAALAISLILGLGPWISAVIAIAVLTFATGAFHEDGLADTADSFGGTTPEQRLEIMKDSRIGTFGASALILSFSLRIAALATLAERLDLLSLSGAVIAAAAISRTAALGIFISLPPARSEGASYSLGQPTFRTLAIAVMLTILLSGAIGAATSLPILAIILALVLPAAVVCLMTRLAARLVRGHTGDLGGATQQLSEIAVLLGVVLAVAR